MALSTESNLICALTSFIAWDESERLARARTLGRLHLHGAVLLPHHARGDGGDDGEDDHGQQDGGATLGAAAGRTARKLHQPPPEGPSAMSRVSVLPSSVMTMRTAAGRASMATPAAPPGEIDIAAVSPVDCALVHAPPRWK